MKKALKFVRNMVLFIVLFIYLGCIICASTLVLNRNDYGFTQFDEKILLDLKNDVGNYSKGQLVIAKHIKFENLKVGDEVFIYKTDAVENTIEIICSTIKEIVTEDTTSPYITISEDGSAWGREYIAGKAVKAYDSIGSVLSFVESKWIFFVIFVVPCFLILLYEIYTVIVVIKFDVDEDSVAALKPEVALEGGNANSDIEQLKAQIDNLKVQLSGEAASTSSGDAPQPVTPDVGAVNQTSSPGPVDGPRVIQSTTVQTAQSQTNVAQAQTSQAQAVSATPTQTVQTQTANAVPNQTVQAQTVNAVPDQTSHVSTASSQSPQTVNGVSDQTVVDTTIQNGNVS